MDAVRALGFTLDPLQGLSFEQTCHKLEELKKAARSQYRKLVFQYHPDRNPGDQEALRIFKALGQAIQQIESLQVQRKPQPVFQVQFVPVRDVIRTAPSYSTTPSPPPRTYDARRVVFKV